MEFSDKMKSCIGKELEYSHPRTGTKIAGICDQIRWSGSFIAKIDQPDIKWKGFEIRLKPKDGGRAFWTKAFPSDVPYIP